MKFGLATHEVRESPVQVERPLGRLSLWWGPYRFFGLSRVIADTSFVAVRWEPLGVEAAWDDEVSGF